MNQPDVITRLWQKRMFESPTWWALQYEAAMSRIEDCTDKEDPYWYSPATEHDTTVNDGMVNDPYGGHADADEIRRCAFELLALADLAEVAALGCREQRDTKEERP